MEYKFQYSWLCQCVGLRDTLLQGWVLQPAACAYKNRLCVSISGFVPIAWNRLCRSASTMHWVSTNIMAPQCPAAVDHWPPHSVSITLKLWLSFQGSLVVAVQVGRAFINFSNPLSTTCHKTQECRCVLDLTTASYLLWILRECNIQLTGGNSLSNVVNQESHELSK